MVVMQDCQQTVTICCISPTRCTLRPKDKRPIIYVNIIQSLALIKFYLTLRPKFN